MARLSVITASWKLDGLISFGSDAHIINTLPSLHRCFCAAKSVSIVSSNIIACDNLYTVSQTLVGLVVSLFTVAFVFGPGLIACIFEAFELRCQPGRRLTFWCEGVIRRILVKKAGDGRD